MVEFKISEDESFFFIKTDGDYPLMIAHSMKRPGKALKQPKVFGGIFEEGGLEYRTSSHAVQIHKSCVPKFKEFILSKVGFPRIGEVREISPEWIVEDCDAAKDDRYHFRLVLTEITKGTEAIIIYWIGDGTIEHVEIDLVAIPELIKFINENF